MKKTKWFGQRELASVDDTTQETVLDALHQNFRELTKEWDDFMKLFQEETKITRLAGKLSRKKNYFMEISPLKSLQIRILPSILFFLFIFDKIIFFNIIRH